jgi:hypothetical protein
MIRAVLPTRRPSATLEAEWEGHPFTVTIGYYLDGTPGEVFADTPNGGQMQATLSDACVLISVALQNGISPEALAKSLAKAPIPGQPGEKCASPVGVIVEAIMGGGT